MKKILTFIGIFFLSLIITFMTFESMSWYHFGDIPTKIVLIRLIICFIVIYIILIVFIALTKKLIINKKGK